MIRALGWLYLGACAVALLVLVLGLPAVAGPDADPLAGLFAFVLALPWILLLDLVAEPSLAVTLVVTAGAMALNAAVLRRLARWRDARPSARKGP